MSNVNALPSIEKLKGRENYETWKFAVRAYFLLDDLWCCIEKPVGTNETENTAIEAKILKNDSKAFSKLVLLIEPINFVHIDSATTAKELWNKLKTVFEDNGLSTRVGLLRALTSTKLVDCASVNEFVTTIITTAHKLRNIGMMISDDWLGTIMLAGLPSEYEPMIMGIESSGMKITADGIKAKLLQDVRNVGAASDGVALFGKKSSKYGSSKSVQNKIRCFNCDKIGHYMKQCREKKKKNDKTEQCKTVESLICTSFLAKENKADFWFIDSGASSHMTVNKFFLQNEKKSNCSEVVVADNSRMQIECAGDVNLRLSKNSGASEVTLKDVQYIPGLCTNLLSVSAMTKQGKSVVFNENGATILNRNKKIIATASLEDNMYRLNCDVEKVFFGKSSRVRQDMWHRRLGHIGFENLKKLRNGFVDGVDFTLQNYEPCENCLKGKHSRNPFQHNGTRASELLEMVHSDLCGPMKILSNGGARYILVFVDDYSRKVFVYFIKFKSEVKNKFVDFKCFVENQTGRKIKILRTDNGTEYCNNELNDFLRSNGILHQLSAPYTPQQNGLAERMNRTLVEKARCMLFESNMDQSFWAEAISTAAFIVNRSPCSGLDKKTPKEAWSGKKPNLNFLRVFGCKAMVFVPKQKRSKFDSKSKECFFVGYSEQSKAYRLFDFSDGKVVVSRDVVFFEDEYRQIIATKEINDNYFFDYTAETSSNISKENGDVDCDDVVNDNSVEAESSVVALPSQINEVNNESAIDENAESTLDISENFAAESTIIDVSSTDDDTFDSVAEFADENHSVYEPSQAIELPENEEIRRSSRLAQLPRQNYAEFAFAFCAMSSDEPITIKEALSSPNAEKWRNAMNEELNSLQENQTWELVKLPHGRKPISSKWVFKVKRDANGQINRYKARLVIKGCAQRHGIDYSETYSPVVRYTSIRYLFALAAKHDLEINQMDAVTAFLQGNLDEDIYMFQPDGFSNGTELVCHLKKSLYGLKQASRVWNIKLNDAFIEFGLNRSKIDPCVYFKIDGKCMLFVAVYVDDIMIFSNDSTMKNQLKADLMKRFKMKDIGEVSSVLGMRVRRDKRLGTISIDQTNYINEVLRRFDMQNCNPISTPMDHNQKLSIEMSPRNDVERAEMNNVPYQEAIGSIMYAAQVTRPDVCFAVNAVSRFMQNPGKAHWIAVKRILRYLKGTANAKLVFSKSGDSNLIGYCDADWAGDVDKRRSTTGYVYLYHGAAISWNSRKQPTVAISTTEAEYMSLAAALQEAMWLKQLQAELENTTDTIVINCDNKSAIDLASTTAYHARSKHIDVRHHFVREKIAERVIKLNYTKTDEMVADIFTKAIVPAKHNLFLQSCGIKY